MYKWYTVEGDILNDAQDMPMWFLGWLYPSKVDGAMELSMASYFSPSYASWWIAIRPCPLGLDELEGGSDGVVSPPLE